MRRLIARAAIALGLLALGSSFGCAVLVVRDRLGRGAFEERILRPIKRVSI
jgi:hypothetical protein